MSLYYLADFFVEDIPGGGAELSDAAILDYLGRDFIKIKRDFFLKFYFVLENFVSLTFAGAPVN